VNTIVRGTVNDGGEDRRELPFPPHFATDTMGPEDGSPGVQGLSRGLERAVPTQAQGLYDGRFWRVRPARLPHTPWQVSGVGAPPRAPEEHVFSAAYNIRWILSLARYVNGGPS